MQAILDAVDIDSRTGVRDRALLMVLYNTGARVSEIVGLTLEDLRLHNIHVYEDGLAGWAKAGNEVVESANAKVHTRGPVIDCRPVIVDRERSYGGAFRGIPEDVGGAGG